MLWIIQTTNHLFEGKTKREFMKEMTEFYALRDQQPEQIKAIFSINKNNKPGELCALAINKLQDILDEKVSEWRQISDQEYRGQKQIESEMRHAN